MGFFHQDESLFHSVRWRLNVSGYVGRTHCGSTWPGTLTSPLREVTSTAIMREYSQDRIAPVVSIVDRFRIARVDGEPFLVEQQLVLVRSGSQKQLEGEAALRWIPRHRLCTSVPPVEIANDVHGLVNLPREWAMG